MDWLNPVTAKNQTETRRLKMGNKDGVLQGCWPSKPSISDCPSTLTGGVGQNWSLTV